MFLTPDLPVVDFKFSFEVRERYERRANRDFSSESNDDRSDLFSRIRPGFELKYGKALSAFVQYQYAHNWAWTPGKTFSHDNSDATQGYLRYAGPEGAVTVGRQKFSVGSERLIGAFEWNNVARSFDGIRFQSKDWEGFIVKIGVAVPKPRKAELSALIRNHAAGQTMLAFKRDQLAAGEVNIWTLDHSQRWKLGTADVDADLAVQGGDNAGKDHEAWAGHFAVGYRPSPADRFYLEANAASGGHDPAKSETFDNLYPTNHKFYGSMDMQGWRNMREIAAGWQRKLDAKTDVHLHGHWFSLMDDRDAWYGAGGAANKGAFGMFKDATGASGSNVGFEVDLEGSYKVDPRTNFQFGIGVFAPGDFVKRLNQGRGDRQTWFFLQVLRKL